MSVAAASTVGPPPGMDVRLSSNESPFGPSPAALAAAREAAAAAHRYPDDQSLELRGALADRLGRPREEVAVGTGSAAVLMDVIANACHGAGAAEVLAFERSFVVYRLAAENAGAHYVEVPTTNPPVPHAPEHRDVDALLARVTDATRVIVVDNPGNPTGAHLDRDSLTRLVEDAPAHVTVVVDEAYHHFARGQRGYAAVDELDVTHPRLLTVTTFSKAYALAGMRVGVLVGPAPLVAEVDGRRSRFNVTGPAQAAAIASLGDEEHLERTVAGTLEGRQRMVQGLTELGVRFADGLGNFVLLDVGGAVDDVVVAYAGHGVGVRPLAPYGMRSQLRVSVGTPPEVDAFLAASREVLVDVPA